MINRVLMFVSGVQKSVLIDSVSGLIDFISQNFA